MSSPSSRSAVVDVGSGGRGDVGHSAGDVLDHDLEVLLAPPVGERPEVDLGGLGIDHDRVDRLGVEAVEDVREVAVAPVAGREVELDEEPGERVEHLVPACSEPRPDEDLAVRERERLVRGDEGGRALLARVVRPALDEPDGTDGRGAGRLERAEHRVVVPRGPLLELLDDVDPVRVREEADLVPADALRQLEQVGDAPVDDRPLPGQVEEVGVPGSDREGRRHRPRLEPPPSGGRAGQAVAGGVVASGGSGSRASIRSSNRRRISSPVARRS